MWLCHHKLHAGRRSRRAFCQIRLCTSKYWQFGSNIRLNSASRGLSVTKHIDPSIRNSVNRIYIIHVKPSSTPAVCRSVKSRLHEDLYALNGQHIASFHSLLLNIPKMMLFNPQLFKALPRCMSKGLYILLASSFTPTLISPRWKLPLFYVTFGAVSSCWSVQIK